MITVNSSLSVASDDGVCTLREAIAAANDDAASGVSAGECVAGSGTDTIRFQIGVFGGPGEPGGPVSITVGNLPAVTAPVLIDGTSQRGTSCVDNLQITLFNSSSAATLTLQADGITVRGLNITGFSGLAGVGIFIDDANSNRIECTQITNHTIGVDIVGNDNIVGVAANGVGFRNVLSGNTDSGVRVSGNGNVVAGNFIGTNAAGTLALANDVGITLGAPSQELLGPQPNTVVAGDAALVKDNLISFNDTGIALGSGAEVTFAAGSRGNCISGNTSGVSNSTSTSAYFTSNWWGAVDGPSGSGFGSGDSVSSFVIFDPFLKVPPPFCPFSGLIVSKSFVDDPVAAGGTVTLEFQILNSDGPAQDIAFTDDLDSALTGLTALGLPLVEPCGPGSLLAAGSGGTDPSVLELTGGRLVPNGSCGFSVTLQVPASVDPGSYPNATSSISAEIGGEPFTGLPATDDLFVNLPKLEKSFTNDPVLPGGSVSLQFTITNTDPASAVSGLEFTDDLGAVVPGLAANVLPADGFCGMGSQITGTAVLSVTGASLAAGASCTFSVTLAVPAAAPPGNFLNETSPLFVNSLEQESPPASDVLQILGIPTLAKEFTDDPVAPGGLATLEFTIQNPDPVRSAREIAFSDDLGAALPSLAALGLPLTDVCGAGSLLEVGTDGTDPDPTVLEFSGGVLGPGASCVFSLSLQVPVGAAPGSHTNTTSSITAEVGGSVEEPGTEVTGAPASDDLIVATIPLLTKSFTDDPAVPGGTVTLQFTLFNPSTSETMSGFGFTDDLGAALTGLAATALPAGGFCGTGSTLTGTSVLTMSGGSLGPGGSCTFSATLGVPASAPPGVYLNTTSKVSAVLGVETLVTGSAATDSLVVVGVPTLDKSFVDDPADAGGTTTLQFTITLLDSPLGATGIAFTDNLGAALTGLAGLDLPVIDPCGPGSRVSASGGDPKILSFTGGSLEPSSSCTFQVDLQVPAGAAPGVYTNTTGNLTASVGGKAVTGGTATDDLTIAGLLKFAKTFTGGPAAPGGSLTLQFTLQNTSATDAATGIAFTDDLGAALSGLQATDTPKSNVCGAGSQISGGGSLSFTGGSLAAGASCTFGVTVQVPAGATPAEYLNTTSPATATLGGEPVTVPPARASFVVADLLSLLKSFTNDPALPGGTVTLQFTVAYSGTGTATGIGFTDDLGSALGGLAATDTPKSNVCGAGSQISGTGVLTLTGGSLAGGGSCTFSVTLQVPGGTAAGSYTNTTGPVTATVGVDTIDGPPATDDLQIAGIPVLAKVFLNDPVAPGGIVTLRFTISNNNPTKQASAISFTDNLAAAVPGLAAIGLPKSDVCGIGSQLAGTTTLTLTAGLLPPLGSCVFDVTVAVPAGAPIGAFTNTTGALTADLQGSPVVGNQAADDLVISPLPLLTKSFIDDPAAPGGAVTLEFTIVNTSPTAAATGITFTDDLGAALTGLAATGLPAAGFCGVGSTLTGTSVLTMSNGTLAPGASCTFSATLLVPAAALGGSFLNTTSTISASVGGVPSIGTAATDRLEVARVPNLQKSFIDDPVAVGGTVTLRFTITLGDSASGATEIAFTDDLGSALVGLQATGLPVSNVCGAGSQISGAAVLSFTGGSLSPNTSCTFDVTLQVPAGAATGSHTNVTSVLTAKVGGIPVQGDAASDDLVVAPPLSLAKSFTDDPVAPGGSVSLEFTLTNSDPALTATGIQFTDDLGAFLPGLAATDTPKSDVCGAGSAISGTTVLSFTGGSLGPGASCTFSVTLLVPASADPAELTNLTSTVQALLGSDEVEAPAATDQLTVAEAADLSIALVDTYDPAVAGTVQIYEIEVTNGGPAAANSVQVEHTLPAESYLLGGEPFDCTLAAGKATCPLGALASGATTKLTIGVFIDARAVLPQVSEATVSSAEIDPDESDNTASATTALATVRDILPTTRVNGGSTPILAIVAKEGEESVGLIGAEAAGGGNREYNVQGVGSRPVDLAEVPNFTGTPSPELAALAFGFDGSVQVLLFDAGDLELLGTAPAAGAPGPGAGPRRIGPPVRLSVFPIPGSWVPIAVESLPDFAGGPAPEVAALLNGTDGTVHVVVLDSGDGAILRDVIVRPGPGAFAVDMAKVASFTGSGVPELVVVSRNRITGEVNAVPVDADAGVRLARFFLGTDLFPLGAAAVQVSGSAVEEFAVLGRRPSDGELVVSLADVSGLVFLPTVFFDRDLLPGPIAAIPSFSDTPAGELAVSGRRDAGPSLLTEIRDGASGSVLNSLVESSPPKIPVPLGLAVHPSFAGGPASELSVLFEYFGEPAQVQVFDAAGTALLFSFFLP